MPTYGSGAYSKGLYGQGTVTGFSGSISQGSSRVFGRLFAERLAPVSLGSSRVTGCLTVQFAPVPLWMHLILENPTLDPILLGASGYTDEVFTVKLVGKTD